MGPQPPARVRSLPHRGRMTGREGGRAAWPEVTSSESASLTPRLCPPGPCVARGEASSTAGGGAVRTQAWEDAAHTWRGAVTDGRGRFVTRPDRAIHLQSHSNQWYLHTSFSAIEWRVGTFAGGCLVTRPHCGRKCHPSQQQEARLFRLHPQDRGHESLVLRQRLMLVLRVSSGQGEPKPGSIDAPSPGHLQLGLTSDTS